MPVKKTGKKAQPKEKMKKVSPSAIPEGTMTHVQTIVQERALTQKEVAECGIELAKHEIQLDQVRKEKKETVREFDNTIKDHLVNIMKFSQAIDTGILSEKVECDVVLDRVNETKMCYPKSGAEPFELEMSPDDFDLLT